MLFVAALCSSGCGPSVHTQWTPYRGYFRLTPKSKDCDAYVAYDPHGIPPYVPIATMSREIYGGLAGSTPDDIVHDFREEACSIGADGVIVPEASRQRRFWGGEASATAFMWARPAPGATSWAPQPLPCVPACRLGFVCSSGACVTACNPPCEQGQPCVVVGTATSCATPSPSSPAQR